MKKTILFSATFLVVFSASRAQTIQTVAGNGVQGYNSDGIQATAAELYYPDAVIFDATGNMYIDDNFNHRIRVVNSAGIITTFAGNGVSGYTGDGGQATAAEISQPVGIIFDNSGNMYIADRYNMCVRKVNTSGIISTIAGNHTGGYNGDGIAATNAELYQPYDLAFDASGNLYIADSRNNRIREVNASGIISTFAGNGSAGYTGDGGAAASAELYYPGWIKYDTASGAMYISDGGNNVIRKVDASGIISTVAGNGLAGFSGDGGPATSAELNSCSGFAIDHYGHLYIEDYLNNRIRYVNGAGIISTIAGTGVGGYSGDGGSPTSAEIDKPFGITLHSGILYFGDEFNNRVREIIGSPAAVNNIDNTKEVTVYPNPFNGSINVVISKPANINLFDLLGKNVGNWHVKGGNNSINTGTLPAGVYFMKIRTQDGEITKKIVKVN